MACVSPATYVWGTDQLGAANQNLSWFMAEWMGSQEQILSCVTPWLNDVLAPIVTKLTDKIVMRKLNNNNNNNNNNKGDNNHKDDTNNNVGVDGMIMMEIKQNYFITMLKDPNYANLCFVSWPGMPSCCNKSFWPILTS